MAYLAVALALGLGCSERRLPLEGGEQPPRGLPPPEEPPPEEPRPEPPAGVPGIYLADADGSHARLFASGERPAWSPDGGQVAFQRAGAIYLSDGTRETLLGDGIEPAWSPDGRIVFTGAQGIMVMADDGSAATAILRQGGIGRPAWSPDGRRIAFESLGDGDVTPPQIYLMNADGTDLHLLSQTGMVRYAESDPAWTPDGSHIVFWSYGYGIAAAPAEGGEPRSLYQDLSAVAYGAKPSVAPNGAILFTANRHTTEAPALWVLEAGAGPRVLLENAMDGVWSPDGRQILFVRPGDGGG